VHLRLSCLQCESRPRQTVTVEIEDRGIYKFTCAAGHASVHQLGNPKFEILFEMGLLAFNDGYTREAVATLAAGVEEFMRFFVNMVFCQAQVRPRSEVASDETVLEAG